MRTQEYSAIIALVVASTLAFIAMFTDQLTANVLILIAQFLVYSLTLYGFGEIARKLYKVLLNLKSQNNGKNLA